MRHLSAALVTITLCLCSLAGDLGWVTDAGDRHVWDQCAGFALVAFLALVIVDRGRE